jgi:hypothetical protein
LLNKEWYYRMAKKGWRIFKPSATSWTLSSIP